MNTAEIMTRQMRLSELLAEDVAINDAMDVELTGIEIDSRQIDAGDLFLAYKGRLMMVVILLMTSLPKVPKPCW